MVLKAAKYGFWGVVIAAIISAIVAVSIHLSEKQDKARALKEQKKVEAQKAVEKKKGLSYVTIMGVEMPSINTNLNSSFLVRLGNYSYSDAKNVVVTINFGEASVSQCETFPQNILKDKSFNTSAVIANIGNIKKGSDIYLYCLISSPIFQDIKVTADNLSRNSDYSLSDYRHKPPIKSTEDKNSSYVTFFKVIGSMVLTIFIGYFTIVVISLLNKSIKLE